MAIYPLNKRSRAVRPAGPIIYIFVAGRRPNVKIAENKPKGEERYRGLAAAIGVQVLHDP